MPQPRRQHQGGGRNHTANEQDAQDYVDQTECSMTKISMIGTSKTIITPFRAKAGCLPPRGSWWERIAYVLDNVRCRGDREGGKYWYTFGYTILIIMWNIHFATRVTCARLGWETAKSASIRVQMVFRTSTSANTSVSTIGSPPFQFCSGYKINDI